MTTAILTQKEYGTFKRKVNALAKGLISLGILKGDRVVIFLHNNSPSTVEADLLQ